MARFDDDYAAAGVPALMWEFGDSITYTPAGGSPVALTADVGKEHYGEVDTENGRRLRRERQVTICRDPSSDYGGVATPKLLDTVTIAGEIWAVEDIDPLDAGEATLLVVRGGDVERSQDNYRRRGRA